MYLEVIKYVKDCKICQRTETNNQPKIGPMGKRLIEKPWTMVAADIMDHGPNFINESYRVGELREFSIRTTVIWHTKTPKYYSQANPTERYNRTIKQIIKAYLENDHATWDNNVDDLQFAINTSKNASTQYTPPFLNLGRELQPLQSLRKSIEEDDDIVFQDENRWTNRLRRLEIIKEEV